MRCGYCGKNIKFNYGGSIRMHYSIGTSERNDRAWQSFVACKDCGNTIANVTSDIQSMLPTIINIIFDFNFSKVTTNKARKDFLIDTLELFFNKNKTYLKELAEKVRAYSKMQDEGRTHMEVFTDGEVPIIRAPRTTAPIPALDWGSVSPAMAQDSMPDDTPDDALDSEEDEIL